MKEKRGKLLFYLAASFFVLFLAIAMLIFLFMRKNAERIVQQNENYLESAASQTAKLIDEQFDQAASSILLVSKLYEMQLESPEFDCNLLNQMSKPTQFDHIRFVSAEGKSWSGEGKCVDATDREYYIEGFKGKSGSCYIPKSRFNTQAMLVFYTPLYYQGKQIGVVNGVYEIAHFVGKLENDLFGRSTAPYLYETDGSLIASSDSSNFSPIATTIGCTRDEVIQAMRSGDTMTLRYNGTKGEGIAYLAPLAGGKFCIIQTFPSTVRQDLVDQANCDTLNFEIAFIVVFLIYLIVLLIVYACRTRRLRREKDDLGQIVDSVKRLYRRFVVFDLSADTYKYLEEGDIGLLGLPSEGKYSEWIEVFRTENNEHPEFWGSMEDMTADALRRTLTQEKWYTHREYPTPDGRWERLVLIKLDLDRNVTARVLGAVEDITDAKRSDEAKRNALEAAFHAAESANLAKSEFLSRMSHDIRTPMNAIVGLTAIMGAHLGEPERLKDCLTKITSSSKLLLSLINEVLDMSKIESGKVVRSEDEFSLPAFVDSLMMVIAPQCRAKQQELTVNTVGIVNENVIGDSLCLRQICVNILSNAVKYTPEGGHISMTLSEADGSSPQMRDYIIAIADDGIGMSPEFLERIFTPFERAEDERVSNVQGTGLGMSIAQNMVRLMGGTITVESEVGKGSVFTVRVALKPLLTDEETERRLVGLPVLVTDDEQLVCESTCLLLKELGMQGEWVLNGREAVEAVKAHKEQGNDFFAVILDWKMPGMDGFETAREIRRIVGEEVPIIILSAYDWLEIEDEARAAGVNAFIGKPLFKSRLRSVFDNLLGNSDAASEETAVNVSAHDHTGRRVLLVEDNLLNQEIAKELLEMEGLVVDLAGNGKIAVERVEESPEGFYDLIFMDIQMPVMNGYEAAKAIRALPRADAAKLPIVALSANTFTDDVCASLEAGMDQHIGKPINMNELLGVLDRYLGG